MPVEFYCPECDAFLRAPDSKAGFSINCPHCIKRCWVPVESETELFIDDEEFDDGDFEESAYVPILAPAQKKVAYACEVCNSIINPGEKVCRECSNRVRQFVFQEPSEVDIGKILSTSWSIYTKHLGPCLAVTLADTVLTIIASVLAAFVGGMAAVAAGNRPGVVILMFFVAAGLGWGLAMSLFAIGHMRFYLDLCRNRQPVLKKSMDFQGPVGHLFLGGIIYWGLFIFILPPVFLWPFGRVVVDQNLPFYKALWISLRLCVRHTAVCFVLLVVKLGAIAVSGLFPFIGALILTPFFAILNSVAYLHFIGEMD